MVSSSDVEHPREWATTPGVRAGRIDLMMHVTRRISLAVAVLGLVAGAAGQTQAGMDLTLAPSPANNVVGNSSTSAPGFGAGSWQAPGSGKSELYIASSSLFSQAVTIGDIASISYWTNKGTTAADPDWTLLLYTKPENDGSDSASWYRTRLTDTSTAN
jgi:hypothetical protein